MVYRIDSSGVISHVAGRKLLPGPTPPFSGTAALNWAVNYISHVKAGNNGWFYFGAGMTAIHGGEVIVPADMAGNVWMLPVSWRQPIPRHQWGEGYDICGSTGDILDAREGDILRDSYSGTTTQIANGVSSGSSFEWSQNDDMVYYADPVAGTVNRLVPSPN
ncbi:MAG: hypothetical protein Q9M23_08805 [Mariprofundaceae bacterium]|nr:hypothetical protein [Mariprofundaceae bacterium]